MFSLEEFIMSSLSKTHVRFVIILTFVSITTCVKKRKHIPSNDVFQNAATNCKNVAQQQVLLNPESVLGEPWRVYYSWNIQLENKCADISFKNATPATIRRFYNDMGQYMEDQPEWGDATLKVNMGPQNCEALLIPDRKIMGEFTGVANVGQIPGLTPLKNSVPLLKFQMKMIDNKFLLFMDCHVGVGLLTARLNQLPHRASIEGIVARIPIQAKGNHACVFEKGIDEMIGEMDHQSLMKELQRG